MILFQQIALSIAAFGVFAALPFSGYWVLSRMRLLPKLHEELPSITLFALTWSIGLVLWSGLLVALALSNHYSPTLLGISGWVVVTYIALAYWQPGFLRTFLVENRWLILGLLALAGIYLGFPTESIYGGRDEGVYANHAVYLATYGHATIPYPWPESLNALFAASWERFPGFLATYPAMTGQFPVTYPLWLGQAYATLGSHGLFGLNGVLAVLSVVIFYGVARFIMARPYALCASVLFGLNPAQIWTSRITLAEIFTQLIIWTGLLLLIPAIKNGNKNLARLGGLVIGFTPFIRLDGFLLLPLLLFAQFVVKVTSEPEKNPSETWVAAYQTAIPLFVLSFAYYVFANPLYYLAHASIVAPAGLAALILMLVIALMSQGAQRYLNMLFRSRRWLILFTIVIVALAIYAYWIRPDWPPFRYIPGLGEGHHRAYRENTFPNLARYLSFPLVWAAIAGWLALVWRAARSNEASHLVLLWVVVGGSAVVYLYEPNVSPDHYWAIRRFVPAVIPGFIIFSVYAASRLTAELPRASVKLVVGVVLLFFGLVFVRGDFRVFSTAEYKGIYRQLESLAKTLPDNELILTDGSPLWVTPLYFTFHKKVIPVELVNPTGSATLASWMAYNKTKEKPTYVLLLRTNKTALPPLPASEINKTTLTYAYVERTVTPLPKAVIEERTDAHLFKISSTPSFVNFVFGAAKSPLIKESGFFGDESNDGGPFRWTGGHASLEVPVATVPRQLRIRFITGPFPATKLEILVNGHTIFSERVKSGEWSKTFKLPDLEYRSNVTITFVADTFLPASLFPGSKDTRSLGIAIREIILI